MALANKESIVCGKALVDQTIDTFGGEILPVDSEQSAIFQCLQNGRKHEVAKLVLTASGGPFWQRKREELAEITPEQSACASNLEHGQKDYDRFCNAL